MKLNIGGNLRVFHRPLIMGVLNLTPDSFFDGGQHHADELYLNHVEKMLEEGADIIDIGAFSSRPGAQMIDEKEELKRLISPLKKIVQRFPKALISIDTYRSKVAVQAIESGAHMINDISAGNFDDQMMAVVGQLNVPYALMHLQGNPQNMQVNPTYQDVVSEVFKYLSEKIHLASSKGIKDILIDPGFGFGKNLEHNYALLKHLDEFNLLERPVLVGISRKSMINKVLGTSPENALNGSSVLNTMALLNGAHILRVHDVKEAVEAAKIVSYYQNI